jgi:hypothetical protein
VTHPDNGPTGMTGLPYHPDNGPTGMTGATGLPYHTDNGPTGMTGAAGRLQNTYRQRAEQECVVYYVKMQDYANLNDNFDKNLLVNWWLDNPDALYQKVVNANGKVVLRKAAECLRIVRVKRIKKCQGTLHTQVRTKYAFKNDLTLVVKSNIYSSYLETSVSGTGYTNGPNTFYNLSFSIEFIPLIKNKMVKLLMYINKEVWNSMLHGTLSAPPKNYHETQTYDTINEQLTRFGKELVSLRKLGQESAIVNHKNFEQLIEDINKRFIEMEQQIKTINDNTCQFESLNSHPEDNEDDGGSHSTLNYDDEDDYKDFPDFDDDDLEWNE